VYRVWRDVQRGEETHLAPVQRIATGEIAGSGRRARRRPVLVGHEAQEVAIRRHDGVANRSPRRLPQALLVTVGDRGTEQRERPEEETRIGVLDDVRRNCHLVSVEHDTRHGVPGFDPAAHVRRVVTEVARHLLQPGDVVLDVCHRFPRRVGRELRQLDVKAIVGENGDAILARLDRREPVLQPVKEHGAADTVGD
jgi:hypothetical protein